MPMAQFEVQRGSYVPGCKMLLILEMLVTARVPKRDKKNIHIIVYYYICNYLHIFITFHIIN